MGDRMTPIPFGNLMNWILTEKKIYDRVFGTRQSYWADPQKYLTIWGEKLETPFGPAAGPHTQLAQNIIAGYVTGCRFFELKTVQTLDGEDLPVAKPCILAEDEGYNCEWSTELRVPEACDEYIKAWIALKVLSVEYHLGAADGFIFNMSVGYDLAGIQSEKIDCFMEALKDASGTEEWQRSIRWLREHVEEFSNVTLADIDGISPHICTSVTVSTLHGCPPQEIERIASYLLKEKGLHTFVKCNPTLLGYEKARRLMDEMGYDYVSFGAFHFENDLQLADAIPMLERLNVLAKELGLEFGVKITNTFPVDVTRRELPAEEMYMSGRALCVLSLSVAQLLSEAFDGNLRISYSGGADYFNIDRIYKLGIWPITVATTLLKPGGYQRNIQMAQKLAGLEYRSFAGVDVEGLGHLIDELRKDPHHTKAIKPLPFRKGKKKVPLFECFTAPCSDGCPIHQDIPAYVKLVGEGAYAQALRVILDKNPLPFITGTICNHRCMDKCTRNFYEEPVGIRGAKLAAAEGGYEEIMGEYVKQPDIAVIRAAEDVCEKMDQSRSAAICQKSAAVVGGGPAGIAAAHFLARAGVKVTVYEKTDVLGGVVAQVVPGFRVEREIVDKDVALAESLGVKFVLNHPVTSETQLEQLRKNGFDAVFVAVGANKGIPLGIHTERELNAIEFLRSFRKEPQSLHLGRYVAVIGAGNTAMDTARAARKVPGVEKVSVIYRRTKRYMPADEEEFLLALEDGVEFLELLAPKCQKNGILLCNRVILGAKDASGRQSPIVTEEEVEIPADTVIASLGEQVDTDYYRSLGIDVDEKGIPVLNEFMESTKQGVYLIGDGARGPATVVLAIRDARTAVDRFLYGAHMDDTSKPDPASIHDDRTDSVTERMPDNYMAEQAAAKKGILIHSQEAKSEADRCLECNRICENCVDVCPNRANVSIHTPGSKTPIILHIDYMCNECGNCQSFCPYDSAPYKEKLTLFANEADLENSTNDGFTLLNQETRRIKLRLNSHITEENLTNPECMICDEIKDIITSIIENRQYLFV